MKQEKLRAKVRELFERQNFKLKETENGFKAFKDNSKLVLNVFSSEKYDTEDIVETVDKGDKVFVDSGLSEVEELIDNDVSVLEGQEEDEEFETPSYEVIGDIAVINDLAGVDREDAVDGILHHQNVKTILLKKGGLEGEFRVGNYEKLYGEETETVHTEFGCEYKVDVTEAFFSEREATERKRILERVKDRERILVMFCGIGPYPTILAKNKDVEVIGVEKNPDAVKYANENIRLNNVEDSVKIIQGDVSEEVPKLGEFDRIIMPSPTNAHKFLGEAFGASKDGSEITLYRIVEKEDKFEITINLVRKQAEKYGFETEVLEKRVVSDYSPHQQKIAIDFKLNILLE